MSKFVIIYVKLQRFYRPQQLHNFDRPRLLKEQSSQFPIFPEQLFQ